MKATVVVTTVMAFASKLALCKEFQLRSLSSSRSIQPHHKSNFLAGLLTVTGIDQMISPDALQRVSEMALRLYNEADADLAVGLMEHANFKDVFAIPHRSDACQCSWCPPNDSNVHDTKYNAHSFMVDINVSSLDRPVSSKLAEQHQALEQALCKAIRSGADLLHGGMCSFSYLDTIHSPFLDTALATRDLRRATLGGNTFDLQISFKGKIDEKLSRTDLKAVETSLPDSYNRVFANDEVAWTMGTLKVVAELDQIFPPTPDCFWCNISDDPFHQRATESKLTVVSAVAAFVVRRCKYCTSPVPLTLDQLSYLYKEFEHLFCSKLRGSRSENLVQAHSCSIREVRSPISNKVLLNFDFKNELRYCRKRNCTCDV